MKTIQLVLTTEDAALEQKIKILEERCEKLGRLPRRRYLHTRPHS